MTEPGIKPGTSDYGCIVLTLGFVVVFFFLCRNVILKETYKQQMGKGMLPVRFLWLQI